MLKLEDDFKISFLFDNSKNEQEESVEKEMIKTAPVVSDCPICNGSIHQTDLSFLCSKNKRISEDGTCTFRLTRKLLDKDIPLEEFKKLVSEKKTGLIKGFISRRTKRRFDANLLLKDNGSIGFEFPPKKRSLPNSPPMPVFKYLVLNQSDPPEYIEVEQSVNDSLIQTSAYRRTHQKSC